MIRAGKAQGRREIAAEVPGAWGLALALALVHLVAAMDRHLLALVLVPIQRELNLGDTQLGFLHGTAYVLLYAGAVVPAGALADRFDRRRIVMAALAVWSLGTLACALAPSFAALVGGRMIVGLGQQGSVCHWAFSRQKGRHIVQRGPPRHLLSHADRQYSVFAA